MPLILGVLGGLPPNNFPVESQFSDFFTGAMSDSNYVLGVTRNSEKGTVLLIVNLQLSDFLQFGNLAIWSHFGELATTASY